jgi:hypothetical protein
MPATRLIVDRAGLLIGRDFMSEGRNLDVLGWRRLDVEVIRKNAFH